MKNEEPNTATTEYGLTEQSNTGSKLCKPPLEKSEDGLLCAGEKAESGEQKAECPEGRFLPIDLLRSGAHELGIELTDSQIDQLDAFAALLVETNKSLNLTRITEPEEIVTGHYLDSFTCLNAHKLKQGSRVIDIGTGAGFPGVPLKIIRPDLAITLLDSSLKKLKFIEDALAKLGIDGVDFVHARAEDAGRKHKHRETYDVALARALSDTKTVVELALPLVKVGGVLIAQKSEGADEDIDSARAILGQLGGKVQKIARIAIPHTDIIRRLVVVWKVKPTPQEFPRAFSRIARTRKEA